jgi:hypothetical protein
MGSKNEHDRLRTQRQIVKIVWRILRHIISAILVFAHQLGASRWGCLIAVVHSFVCADDTDVGHEMRFGRTARITARGS